MAGDRDEMKGSVWFDFRTPFEPVNPKEEVDLKSKPTKGALSPADLAQIYSEEGRIPLLKKRLSLEYGVPVRVTRFLMDQLDVPIMHKRARERALLIQQNWRDPDKRQELMSKVHSPQARRKRSAGVKLSWQVGARGEERREMLDEVRRKIKQEYQKSKLGEDPRAGFQYLRDQGLNDSDIAKQLGVSISTLLKWREELGQSSSVDQGASNLPLEQRKRMRDFIDLAMLRGELSGLDERSMQILQELYPSSGLRPSRKKVGEKFGISYERVRQIELRILNSLGYRRFPQD